MRMTAFSLSLLLTLALLAAAYHRNSDWQDDLSIWGDAIRKNSGNANAFYYHGIALGTEGLLDQAIADFTAAIGLDSRRPYVYIAYAGRGVAYAKQGKFDSALEDLSTSLALNPDYDDA